MRLLLALMTVWVMVTAASAEESTGRVLAAAQAAQVRAETSLAQQRAEHLAERAELAAAVAAAERQLYELRRANAASTNHRDRLAAEVAAAESAAAQRARRAQDERAMLARTCAVDPDPDLLSAVAAAWDEAIAALQASAVVRGGAETVIDRQGHQGSAMVVRLGAVAAVAISDMPERNGLLIDDGVLPRVAGPVLPAVDAAAVADLHAGTLPTLPCDPSAELAERPAPAPWTLAGWLAAGGAFAWPIVAVVLIALVIAGERAVALMLLRAPPSLLPRVLTVLHDKGVAAAAAMVAAGRTPLERVLRTGLSVLDREHRQREAALEASLLAEEPRFERALTLLAACAAVAPLLGLLGTVTGMIRTFDVIAVHGTGNPRLLSGGIAEALVTTQMGLLAAVPILLIHAWIGRQVDKRQVRLEEAATALLAVESPR
ncbi:MAG: MotA/TolQ/ExbB proton channel family protein [Planctomycetota bacterium]|jgi:biopolymer transport protein ExbB